MSTSNVEGRESLPLESYIRSIPDFPKAGIVFRDITPLLASAEGLDASLRANVVNDQRDPGEPEPSSP